MTKERELLEETLLFLDEFEYPTIVEEIRAFLAAEEQYDALRERYVEGLGNSMKDCKESFEREAERVKELLTAEPEAELVGQRKAFICTNCDCVYEVPVSECDCASGANQFTEAFIVTRPEPARKPMTEEEIDAGFRYGDVGYMNGFFEGIRFAEKHHGIGGDDNG